MFLLSHPTETFLLNLLILKSEKVLTLLLLGLMVAEKAHFSESSVVFGPSLAVFYRDLTFKSYFTYLKDPIYLQELLEIK